MRIEKTPEFDDWLEGLDAKARAQVEVRLLRIVQHNHFGDARYLGDSLAELRWKNGRRVYFVKKSSHSGPVVVLLYGGMKNGQKKDIEKARLLIRRYAGS